MEYTTRIKKKTLKLEARKIRTSIFIVVSIRQTQEAKSTFFIRDDTQTIKILPEL